jgi:prepilin-type N-terminal cleavage/methylation domain-containing protein
MKLQQKGFSLIELMVAIGLLGGISLVTMKLFQDQKANEVYIKSRAEIAKVVSLLEMTMSEPNNCRQIFAGKTKTSAGVPVPKLAVTFVDSTGVTNERILLETGTGSTPKNYRDFYLLENDILLKDSPLGNSTVAELELRFRVKHRTLLSQGMANDHVVVKKIPFVVSLASGVINECGPALGDANDLAKQQLCTDMGALGAWDSVNKVCRLNQYTCPAGQVASGFTPDPSSGSLIFNCVDSADQINLADFFDLTPHNCTAGAPFSIINSGGKFRIKCN